MMHSRVVEVKGMKKKNQDSSRRNIKMQSLRNQGFSDTEIARLVGLTPERVGQILGRKKSRKVEDANPEAPHAAP